MIREYVEKNSISLISISVVLGATVIMGVLTAYKPLVAIAVSVVASAMWILAQRPNFGAWILSAGVMFPIVVYELFGVNVKAIDLTIVILSTLAILNLLFTKQTVAKWNSRANTPSKVMMWGYILFFVGVLMSWFATDERYQPTIYLVEAIEAYALTFIIVFWLYREPTSQRHLLIALVAMGVVAGVHGILAVQVSWLMPIDYYTLEAGAYEGVLRVRGYHSFAFGFVEAIAAIVTFAFLLETLDRLVHKRTKHDIAIAATLLLLFGFLNYVIVASLVRVWLLAEGTAICVVLMRRQYIMRGNPGRPAVLLGFGIIFLIVLVGFLVLSFSGLFSANISYVQIALARFSESSSNLELRFEKWRLAWNLFGGDILWGVGGGNAKIPEGLSIWYASYGDIDNGYLQVLMEVGIMGFIGMVLMLIGSLARTISHPMNSRHIDPRDMTANTAILGGIVVVSVSLLMWNLWSQGSSGAIFTGLLIALAFSSKLPQDERES